MEKIEEYYDIDDPREVTQQRRPIGNRELLLDYLKSYPEDYQVLLASYRALPADELITEFLKIKKCISKSSIEPYVSEWRNNGYDYLVLQFGKLVSLGTRC